MKRKARYTNQQQLSQGQASLHIDDWLPGCPSSLIRCYRYNILVVSVPLALNHCSVGFTGIDITGTVCILGSWPPELHISEFGDAERRKCRMACRTMLCYLVCKLCDSGAVLFCERTPWRLVLFLIKRCPSDHDYLLFSLHLLAFTELCADGGSGKSLLLIF